MNYITRTSAETQNETRENTMICQKQKTFSVTWSLFSAACLALFLAPGLALAQNECGLQVGATPVECDQASYPDGVTYTAVGDLFVEFTADPTTEVEAGGIDLTAMGGDSISFDSATTATEIESRGTSGALLDVTTVNGNIGIQTEEMDADGQTPGAVSHAIRAMSDSGNIDIVTSGHVDAASGSNPADSIGIEAATGGAGTLIITTASGSVNGNDAAIDASTGSGLLTINVTGGSGTVGGSSDIGIRANAGGNAVINIGAERNVSGGLDLTTGGQTTVNNDGSINFGAGVVVSGGALTLNNNGTIRNTLDFNGANGAYTLNNNVGAIWDIGGNTINNLGPDGSINNAGTIVIRRGSVLSAPGATFTGSGEGRTEMTVDLADPIGQSSCANAIVAGCIDLTGGETVGQTAIRVDIGGAFDPFASPKTARSGIVLIDVSGGTSEADHFVLHPDSENYETDSTYGGVLDVDSAVDYALLYNPETQQHILASVSGKEGVEYGTFIEQALSVWHTAGDAVVGRQADLRDGALGGGWVRVVGEHTSRDATLMSTVQGNTFTYDRSYSLDTGAVITGFDLTSGDDHAFGVHTGLISARTDYDDSSTSSDSEGAMVGVYGSWWDENGLSLDAALNVTMLELRHTVSEELEDSSSNMVTAGVRMEAGWRLVLNEALYLQPLVTAAYAKAEIEDLELRQNRLAFDDAESLRGAIGARLGGEKLVQESTRMNYWLIARAWEEYRDEGQIAFATDASPLVVQDDISGSFEELGFGVSFSGAKDVVTVFASGGMKSGNDVESYNLSLGARLHW